VWCTFGTVKTAQCTEDGIKGPMMMMNLLLYCMLKSDTRKYAVSYQSIL